MPDDAARLGAANARLRTVVEAKVAEIAGLRLDRSYLDSATAHGITAIDAIRSAIQGKPWVPPLPAIA